MQIGAVLSQGEVAGSVAELRDYAQAVQELGYDFLVASDHVVGADAADYPHMERVFSVDTIQHEPLTLFAFLAGVAPRLGFLTSVVILPQRQATLVAKQAAEVDVLCQGHLRLGVGIGWNPIEFEALGTRFEDRARRFEEQVKLMRRLWTERLVTLEGKHHTVRAAGLNPRPVQQPIPIWVGAAADKAVRRACRIADGYLPLRPLDGGWEATMEKVHGWLREAGRDPASFGIEGRLDTSKDGPHEWRKTIEMWRGFGASHLSVGTSGAGNVDAHVQRLRQVKELLAA